jgi:hypothetical protein
MGERSETQQSVSAEYEGADRTKITVSTEKAFGFWMQRAREIGHAIIEQTTHAAEIYSGMMGPQVFVELDPESELKPQLIIGLNEGWSATLSVGEDQHPVHDYYLSETEAFAPSFLLIPFALEAIKQAKLFLSTAQGLHEIADIPGENTYAEFGASDGEEL